MVLAIGILLVVEVVDERDEAPRVFVLAPHPRVAAHRGLDGQQMLAQALALHVLGHERPRALARRASASLTRTAIATDARRRHFLEPAGTSNCDAAPSARRPSSTVDSPIVAAADRARSTMRHAQRLRHRAARSRPTPPSHGQPVSSSSLALQARPRATRRLQRAARQAPLARERLVPAASRADADRRRDATARSRPTWPSTRSTRRSRAGRGDRSIGLRSRPMPRIGRRPLEVRCPTSRVDAAALDVGLDRSARTIQPVSMPATRVTSTRCRSERA